MNEKQRVLIERAHKALDWWYTHPGVSKHEVYKFAKSIGVKDPIPADVDTLILVARELMREALEGEAK
jgi:hypothetical protein